MDLVLYISTVLLAAMFVMVIHELPKSIVYRITSTKKDKLVSVVDIGRYIDPIGLIFCVATGAGFSKPYKFKIETKRQAMVIGLTGFGSLLVLFLGAMIVYTCLFRGVAISPMLQTASMKMRFVYLFLTMVILLSLGMFIVNLLPIAAFDMGMIVAGVSLPSYIAMIRKDSIMKLVLFIILGLRSIPILVIHIVNLI